MEEKFSFKLVHNGQTKLSRQVRTGAGANGQALVVKAEDAAHYQLVNLVTLTSPAKMQLKRKGDDLQLSLPGGDPDMPDVIIQGYFAVEGNVLNGISQNGEWMAYDTSVFVPKSSSATDKPVKPVSPDSPVAIGLAEPPMGLMNKFDSPVGLASIGGGVLAFSSIGHGGSSSGSVTSSTDNFSVFKAYAGTSAASAVAPTVAQYTTAGVTVPTVDSVTSANVLAALNQVVSSKAASDVSSKAQLQALADALKSSWALIIAEANGSNADATPNSSPSATDYLNVGVKVGTTTKTFDLMNSALAELPSTSVDTTAEIKDLAVAADNLMKLAAGTSGASVSNTDLNALGLKINGVSSAVTTVHADGFSKNLANLETSLGKSDDFKTGAAVDTLAEVQALFSLQAMRSYNDDTATTKVQPAPGVVDYTNIGIKSYDSTASNPNRIDLDANNFGVSNLQTTLNSALDNQPSGTALTKTLVQTMVDAYYKVLKEAGSTSSSTGTYVETTYKPGIDEFKSLGITHTDKTALVATDTSLLSLLNTAIGRLSSSAVDTTTEIQALEKAAENILAQGLVSDPTTPAHTYGVTYTTDSEWLSGFSALGISGVTASNLSGIKTAIDNKVTATDVSAIDTVKELQAIVSLYRINDYASTGNSSSLPTLKDYQEVCLANNPPDTFDASTGSLKDPNTTDGNYLNAYNDAVNIKSFATVDFASIRSLVVSYNKILDEANGTSADTNSNSNPVGLDFLNIGVGDGSSSRDDIRSMLGISKYAKLLTDVISNKSVTQVDSITELNALALVVERIKELDLLDKTQGTSIPTNPDLSNYQAIKGGMMTTSELQTLGLDISVLNDQNVTSDVRNHRLYDVFDHIINASALNTELDSLAKLQTYINNSQSITG